MRLRDLFRRPAPSPDSAPAVRPAVPPAWPDLPPLQRVVSSPSLVTAPEGFRQGLASWGNPSFLGTPGHLVTPDAPSGSVAGLTRPAVRWDAPPAIGSSRSAPVEEPVDDGAAEADLPVDDGAAEAEPPVDAVAEPAEVQRAVVQRSAVQRAVVQPVPVQRTLADPLPMRHLPTAPEIPGPRPANFVSAAAAPVPEPVWRPAVPEPEPTVHVQRADEPHVEGPHVDVPHAEVPHIEAPPVEAVADAEAPPETVVPVPSQAPLPVQTLADVPAAQADPLPAPRRRLGLGAPLPAAEMPVPQGPTGLSPLVARLLDASTTPAPRTVSSAGPMPMPPGRAETPSPSELASGPAEQSASAVDRPGESPVTVVQRHPDHEEAPLVGAVPLALPPTDEVPVQKAPVQRTPAQHPPVQHASVQHASVQHAPVQHAPVEHAPVQRTYAPGPAPQSVPPLPGALPPPAGQSTRSRESGLPSGTAAPDPAPADVAPPAPEPIAETSAPPPSEVVAPLAGERPLVARLPETPNVAPQHSVESMHTPLPAPVTQRQTDGCPVPAVSGSVLETHAGAGAGTVLVGERPIAQRLAEPASAPAELAAWSLPAPATLSTPTTAVQPLGERPIVLRALSPVAAASRVPSVTGGGLAEGQPVQRLAERVLPPAATAAARMPTTVPTMPAPRALPSVEPIEPPTSVATEPPPETVTVSRLASPESDAPAAAAEGAPTAAAEAAPAAAPAAELHAGAPAAHGGAPAQASVDAEVHRLFDPLARQFRAELRLDRERVGHALDLRY